LFHTTSPIEFIDKPLEMSNLYLSKVNGQNGTEQKTIKRIYTTKQINVLIQSNQCTLSEDADLLNINSH